MSANDSEIVKALMIGSFLANFLIILILDELSSFEYQPVTGQMDGLNILEKQYKLILNCQ